MLPSWKNLLSSQFVSYEELRNSTTTTTITTTNRPLSVKKQFFCCCYKERKKNYYNLHLIEKFCFQVFFFKFFYFSFIFFYTLSLKWWVNYWKKKTNAIFLVVVFVSFNETVTLMF